MEFTCNIVDIHQKRTFFGKIRIEGNKIASIEEIERDPKPDEKYIIPGLVDSHVHVESSMLIPSEFARAAVVHGVVATVSDPHEIANVLGVEGVKFMIDNGKKTSFKFFFGAPSCVPATPFETAGANLGAKETEELLKMDDIYYLSEMMNFPGVINRESYVMEKLDIAKKFKKPIDGHAPGVVGEMAEKYVSAGISTDHECSDLEEAKKKISLGMKILIREGSAVKNFGVLHHLIKESPEMVMFCSDDRHPDDLERGHINEHVKRALDLGYDVYDVLRCASAIPVSHYSLNVGLLREGDDADFVIISDLKKFEVLETYIRGEKVAEDGKTLLKSISAVPKNNFNVSKKDPADFKIQVPESKKELVKNDHIRVQVIGAMNGEILTTREFEEVPVDKNGNISENLSKDVLKISVVNRFKDNKPSVAFIKGFMLKRGAFAQSVAHDSHNIVAIGTSDDTLCKVVNAIIDSNGGLAVYDGESMKVLPLPFAGLMSSDDFRQVSKKYSEMDRVAKKLTDGKGKLDAPFMTLSFMALPVIPILRLSDLGLFDGETFSFTDVVV